MENPDTEVIHNDSTIMRLSSEFIEVIVLPVSLNYSIDFIL